MMKRKRYVIIIAVLAAIFSVSTFFLIRNHIDSKKQAEIYDELIETVEDTEETQETMSYSEDQSFLPDYQELFLQNNDMVGWIKVEDTKINYPVMQSKEEPNFYLRHGFDKAYTVYGCPYVQENCDVDAPSDNLIIYGHHMNDQSMFAGLMKYQSKSFWENHKTVQFDTLTENQNMKSWQLLRRLLIPMDRRVLNIIILSTQKMRMSSMIISINAKSWHFMIRV